MAAPQKTIRRGKRMQNAVEWSFLILGIGSLTPFNAIISAFDFFIYFQKGYSPQLTFPNINFGLNFALQLLFLYAGNLISNKIKLIGSSLLSLISLISLPLVVLNFEASTSFIICCGIMVLVGISNAFSGSSIFGLVSFFPIQNVIAVGTGQGIAGIIINVIRYFILFSLGDGVEDLKKGAFIFFGASALIIFVCLIVSIMLYKNKYFVGILEKSGEIPRNKKKTDESTELLETNTANSNKVNKNKRKKEKEFSFVSLMIKLFDINFLIMLNFVITFLLFPGVSIKPAVFGMSMGWKINTIIFLFNVCDTIGKSIVNYITPTKTKLYLIGFGRITLAVAFYHVLYCEHNKSMSPETVSYLTLLNVGLLAITSGMMCSLCFGLAPNQVENEWKGKAGSSVSLCLVIGIFFGSFAGILMDKITTFG